MKTQWFAAGAVLALAVGLFAVPASWAKPADLPSQNGIECPDGSGGLGEKKFHLELDITSKGITLKFGASAAPELPATLDTVLPAFVEQWLYHVGDMLMRPDRFVSLDALLARMPRVHTAYFGGPKANADSNDSKRQRIDTTAEGAQKAQATLEMRLFEPVNVRIKDVPLKQALKNLAHASGMQIVPDYAALKDARVDLDTPVSLALENTSLHTALQQLLEPMRLTLEIENGMLMVTTPAKGSRTPADRVTEKKHADAQRLFEVAERHRRDGEYNLARKLYQQVHLLTPTTLHGRMAIVRIIDIEDRMRDVSEEQTDPIPGRSDDPEQVLRDLLERSIPLGLVDVSY